MTTFIIRLHGPATPKKNEQQREPAQNTSLSRMRQIKCLKKYRGPINDFICLKNQTLVKNGDAHLNIVKTSAVMLINKITKKKPAPFIKGRFIAHKITRCRVVY